MYRVQNTVTYNEIFQDQNYYQNLHNPRSKNVSDSSDKFKNSNNHSLSLGLRQNPSSNTIEKIAN